MHTDTASLDTAGLAAFGSSLIYARLAAGFAHPGGRLAALLAGPPEPSSSLWSFSGERTGLQAGALADALARVRRAAEETTTERLQASYMRLFDPRRPPLLLEAEYRTAHFQQRTELLADLVGFYRAFGAVPDRERPDHLACELDFLHLVRLKEARARAAGRSSDAQTCARAARAFLDDHLLAWYGSPVAAIRGRAQPGADGLYLALADALCEMMRTEGE